jgi:hypothetical protein
VNKLINSPNFFTSLTDKQHRKLAEFFQFKITEPTNAEKYIYSVPINTQIANALMKKRDVYIIFSGIIMINEKLAKAPQKDRLIWLDSMDKTLAHLYEASVCETELDEIKDSFRHSKHLNSSQKHFLQLESGLCDQLAFLEKGLLAYQATLPKRPRTTASKNEKVLLENMIHNLRNCIFETLSQTKNIYS